ncbi:DHA2 family efflux MFS transporter permease subunit [Priestia megaterium]|uniref:DHA2 family efflux MFS transporter permease subunit n=1 Tax=Priestia megaterium TaxID=1404 RepID=UPI0036731F90
MKKSEANSLKVGLIMASFMLAAFIGTFNETALNVALSTLMQEFSVSESTIQWLTTGYLLTQGVLVPLSGLLIKWFPTRKLFLTSVSFSIIGAFIGAMSGTFEVLMVARLFQAIGTALLLPLMFNTVLIIFPAEKRGSAMGLATLVFTAAPAVGPTVSGLLIAKLSWHWIFWLSFIFLLIALVFGFIYMQNVSKITKPRIDLFSLFMSTLGFGGIVFGFSSIGEYGWDSLRVITSMSIGLIALALFVIRQLTMKKPLMNVRAFKQPMFVFGTLLMFICKMIILSSMLLLPMYLIRVLGMSALSAGIILLPGGLVFALLSPVVGRLFDKFGPKWLAIPGLVIAVVVLWFFSNITTTSTIALIVTLHCCLMIGIVMIWMPSQTNGLNQLPPEMYPDGTAIMNTLLQMAGAIGMAVAVSVMTAGVTKFMKDAATPSDPHNNALALNAGIQDAFVFVLSVAIIGLIIGVFIKRVKISKSK